MKILKLLVWIVLLFAAYIFFLRSPDQKKGESAPDFTAELITGEQFNLSDLRGDYVLLDFWGSWCGPSQPYCRCVGAADAAGEPPDYGRGGRIGRA